MSFQSKYAYLTLSSLKMADLRLIVTEYNILYSAAVRIVLFNLKIKKLCIRIIILKIILQFNITFRMKKLCIQTLILMTITHFSVI